MAIDYLEIALDARDSLQEAGAVVALTWTPPPTNPAPDAEPPEAVVVWAYGCIFDYNSAKIGTQPDSLIKAGDRQILLSALDLNGAQMPEPPVEALIVGPDGAAYVLKVCKPVAPAGVAVIFDLNVRRP